MTGIRKNLVLKLILYFLVLFCFYQFALAETNNTGEKISVEAVGQAFLEDDKGITKEKALQNAFRNALEKAFGTKITTATAMKELTITSDVVISQTWGHILSYKIIEEWENKDKFFVKISAQVSTDARWWAEFEEPLNIARLHVKDLALVQSHTLDQMIQPGGLYHEQVLVIPFKSNTYGLLAVHTETLQVVWEKKLTSKLTSPLVSHGEWVIAITDRVITVYNLFYGWIKWTYDVNEPITGTPVVDGNTVYLTTRRGNLYAINLNKGKLKWKYSTRSYFLSSPSLAGNKVYFTDSTGYLYCLDILKQSLAFKIKINQLSYYTIPMPTKIMTYMAWNNGHDTISALDSTNGDTIWSFQGDIGSANSTLPPYLFKDQIIAIFTHKNTSRIYRLNALTGQLLWKKELQETVTDIKCSGDGLIILNTWQGIKILDLEYGNLLWEGGMGGLKNHLILGEDSIYYTFDNIIEVYK